MANGIKPPPPPPPVTSQGVPKPPPPPPPVEKKSPDVSQTGVPQAGQSSPAPGQQSGLSGSPVSNEANAGIPWANPISETDSAGNKIPSLPNYEGRVKSPTAEKFASLVKDKTYKLGAKGLGNYSYVEKEDTLASEIDCSGAVCTVRNAEGKDYPLLGTNAAKFKQLAKTQGIPKEQSADGDLILMNTEGKGIDHIGFVVVDEEGRRYIAESSSTYGGTTITPFDERLSDLQKRKGEKFTYEIVSDKEDRGEIKPYKGFPAPVPFVENGLPVGVAAPPPAPSKFDFVWDTGTRPEGIGSGVLDSTNQLPKPAEPTFTGTYTIDGKPVTGKKLRDSLFDREFVDKIQQGQIDVTISNDEHLQGLFKKQLESGSELGDKWDYLKSGAATLAAGIEGLPAYVSDVVSEVSGFELPKELSSGSRIQAAQYAQIAKEATEKTRQYEGGFVESVVNGNLMDAFQQGNNMLAASAPVSITMAATGGAGIIPSFAAMTPVLASSEYAMQAGEKKEDGSPISRGEALGRSTLYGVAEYAGEGLVTGPLLRKNFNFFKEGYKYLTKKAAQTGGEQAGKEIAKQSANELLKRTLINYGVDTQKEGVSEVLTGVAQDLTDDLMGIKDVSFEEYVENAVDNYAAGVYMGGFIGVGGLAKTGMKIARDRIKTEEGVNAVASKVDEAVERGTITPQQAEQAKSEIVSDAETLSKIPSNQQDNERIFELEKEKIALEKEIEGKDPELVGAQEERVNEINNELKELTQTPIESLSVHGEKKAPEGGVLPEFGQQLKAVEIKKDEQGNVVAPNGRPSLLYANLKQQGANDERAEKIYKTTRTPSFKRWFGDWENDPENSSQMVDENGEPLLFYHGSVSPFVEFQKSKRGSATKLDDAAHGFYFTTNPDVAKAFIGAFKGQAPPENKGVLMPVFLNAKNIHEATENIDEFFFGSPRKTRLLKRYSNEKDGIVFEVMDRKPILKDANMSEDQRSFYSKYAARVRVIPGKGPQPVIVKNDGTEIHPENNNYLEYNGLRLRIKESEIPNGLDQKKPYYLYVPRRGEKQIERLDKKGNVVAYERRVVEEEDLSLEKELRPDAIQRINDLATSQRPINEYIVFEPNQIKSIHDEKFDPESPITLEGADVGRIGSVTSLDELDEGLAKTKLTDAEKKAIASKTIDQAAQWLKDKLSIEGLDDVTKHGIGQNEIIDLVAQAVKQLVNTGIDIQEALNRVVQSLKEGGFMEGVDEKAVMDAIDSSAKYPSKPSQKLKSLLNRGYEGVTEQQKKEAIEKHGRFYDVESHVVAQEIANSIISDVGLENAYEAVKTSRVVGAPAAFIHGRMVDFIGAQIESETDPEAIKELVSIQADMLSVFDNKAREGGRFNSALQAVYADSDFNYKFERQVEKYKEVNNGEIPAEIEEKFRQWDKEMTELRKKVKELEEQKAKDEEQKLIDNIKEAAARKKKKSTTEANKLIAEGFDELMSAMSAKASIVGDERPKISNALTKIGLGLIKKGEATLENVIEKISEYIEKKTKAKINPEDYRGDIEKGIKKALSEETTPGKIKIPHALIRSLVENGFNTMDELVAAVKQAIADDYPNATEREIRDTISGYGRTVNQSKEEIEIEIRKMKRMMRLTSALEDVRKRKRPLRSGLQRDKLDAEERGLMKELREAMKDLPMDEETQAREQKTMLDTQKQSIQNQIEDLEREIATGQKASKSTRTLQQDQEIKDLIEQRNKLKEEHDAIFKDEEFQEKRRLEQAKERAKRRIEDLERRIRDKDYSKRKVKPIIGDTELDNARADILRLKYQFDKEQEAARLRQRTAWQKIKEDFAREAWNLSRMIKATGEMSWIWIQNGPYTLKALLTNRTLLKEAFRDMFRALSSESKSDHILKLIQANPKYKLMRDSKLSITEPSAKLSAREEQALSGWMDYVWDYVIGSPLWVAKKLSPNLFENPYQRFKRLNPPKALERAAVAYSNTLKVSRFLEAVEMLEFQNIKFQDDPQAYKNVADVVNTFSGRSSLGKSDAVANGLTIAFFSPRLWVSVVKQLSLPVWMFTLSDASKAKKYKALPKMSVAQKMALADFMYMFASTTALVAAAAAYFNNDDDEETGVETDPLSSDYMKIKIGNTRIDPWRGMQQHVVLINRFITESMVTSSGELRELGSSQYIPTRLGLIGLMFRNKLSPSAALTVNYLDSRRRKIDGEYVRTDAFGTPLYDDEQLTSNVLPIFIETIGELYKEQPALVATYISALAFFGVGTQTYESKGKSSFDIGASRQNPLRQPMN